MKKLNGYISLEGAVIVPFVFLVLLSVLMLSVVIRDLYVGKACSGLLTDSYVIAGEKSVESEGGWYVYTAVDTMLKMDRERLMTEVTALTSGKGLMKLLASVFSVEGIHVYRVKSPLDIVRTVDSTAERVDLPMETGELEQKSEDYLEATDMLFR